MSRKRKGNEPYSLNITKKKRTTQTKDTIENDEESVGIYDKKILDLTQLTTLKASQAFNWLYGISPNFEYEKEKVIKQSNTKQVKTEVFTNPRDWWERASPVTQCENTVGSYKIGRNGERNPNIECYICGLPLIMDEIKNPPECEHILPVFLGSLLLTLYRTEFKKSKNLQIDNELSMEYAWAHRCCNQVKKDISLIKFDDIKDKFVFNVSVCEEMLKKIKESSASYCSGKLKTAILNDNKKKKNLSKNWVTSRLDSINYYRINPICDYLNKYMKENGKGIFYLSILASLISSADMRLISIAQDKSGQMKKRKREIETHISRIESTSIPKIKQDSHNGESMIKATIYHYFADYWAKKIVELKENPLYNKLHMFTVTNNMFNGIKGVTQIINDYNTSYNFVMSCFMSNNLTNKTLISLKQRGFQYNYISRDIFSILFFSDQFTSILRPTNGNIDLSVNISIIATKIAILYILYTNITDEVQISDIETIKSKFKSEILNLLKKFKIELFKTSGNLYNYISFIIYTIVSEITDNKINELLMIDGDTISINKENEVLVSYQNLLYCRIEYYKKYSKQYQELIDKIKSVELNDEMIPYAEIIAVNILTGLKDGEIKKEEIKEVLISPNKSLFSTSSKFTELFSTIFKPTKLPLSIIPSPLPQLSQLQKPIDVMSDKEKEDRSIAANNMLYLQEKASKEYVSEILMSFKSKKLTKIEQNDLIHSLTNVYKTIDKNFFKEDTTKHIIEDTVKTINVLDSIGICSAISDKKYRYLKNVSLKLKDRFLFTSTRSRNSNKLLTIG